MNQRLIMVKRTFHILLLMVVAQFSAAQPSNTDSLKHQLAISENDTINLILLGKIAADYTETNPDSAGYYAERMLPIARKLNLRLEEMHALGELGYAQLNMGNYPRSLQTILAAIAIGEDPKSEKNILPAKYMDIDEFSDRTVAARVQRIHKLSRMHEYAGILYGNTYNYEKALSHYYVARDLAEASDNKYMLCIINQVQFHAC